MCQTSRGVLTIMYTVRKGKCHVINNIVIGQNYCPTIFGLSLQLGEIGSRRTGNSQCLIIECIVSCGLCITYMYRC